MNKEFSISFILCSGFALANLLYFLGMILLNRVDKRVSLSQSNPFRTSLFGSLAKTGWLD